MLLCGSAIAFSAGKKNTVLYDTSKVSDVKISPEKEKEIFSDKDFFYKKDVEVSKSWWDMFLDWFSKILEKLLGKTVAKHPNASYQLIKYLVLLFFIIGVVVILWKSKFRGLFKGDSKKTAKPFDDLPENIEGLNLNEYIENAIKAGDYRLDIRWSFLKSLQWLNKQNKITWQTAKTNVDYQNELKDGNLKGDFISLSRVFEYVWYGETIPTEKMCQDYKSKVDNFISTTHV